MNQEIQPLLEVDAMKVAVGSTPDPEVAALLKRRQFSAAYKHRIVREANACQVPGEIGALLRREGLYSSHLTHWRREVEASEQAALVPKPRGPKPDLATAESRRVEALEREVARLRHTLEGAEQIIDAQKNYADCWGCPWARSPRDEQRQGGRPADRHRGRREIPNFCTSNCRVVRFRPSFAAAPDGPEITQFDSFGARRMCSRATS